MSLGLYLNKQQVAFLIHPKQTNKYSNINKRYGREVTAKNINKLAVTILEEVFLQQKKPTELQAFSPENPSATLLSTKLLPLTQRTFLDPLHSSLLSPSFPSSFPSYPRPSLAQQATTSSLLLLSSASMALQPPSWLAMLPAIHTSHVAAFMQKGRSPSSLNSTPG